MSAMRMAMIVMMTASAQEKYACDIDDQTERGDRNSLIEIDSDRKEQARDGLVGNQQRDHGQYDGAGESGEIAELAGAEGKALVIDMVARVAVGQGGQQQRAGMGRHVQPVGNESDRAEQQAAGDLGDHHETAQRDHHPGAALVLLVAFAEEY